MKKDDKASISLKKVISVSIILLLFMGISVLAVNSKVNNVKIILSNGYEMDVLTTKEKVSDILNDNHIILLPEENVIPGLDSNISDNKTIRITTDEVQTVKVTEAVVTSNDVTVEVPRQAPATVPTRRASWSSPLTSGGPGPRTAS